MIRSLRLAILVGMLGALVLGTGTVLAGPGPGEKLIDSGMAGLPPAFVNPAGTTNKILLAGVAGAGHAWAIRDGHASLERDGHLDVHVHGLVLTPEGINPVTSGRAIVSCNGGADIVLSSVVSFNAKGDAHVHETVSLPSQCLAPVIFFGNASGASWFAVSG
jgi:hypothetical protein